MAGRLAGLFGLSYLSREFLRFARMHFLYLVATNLSGVFISTFLLTGGSSLRVVGLFYILGFFFESCGYFIVASLSRTWKTTRLTRLGLALYAGSYLALLLLREQTLLLIPLTAFLASTGAAFYWLPYHNYTINYTTPDNRQQGISFMGMVGNLIVLVAPPLSGFLVSRLPGLSGYTVISSSHWRRLSARRWSAAGCRRRRRGAPAMSSSAFSNATFGTKPCCTL